MIRPKSLQQRLLIFMIFPVALLLIGMGIVGYVYAKNRMLDQWEEAAILKLQRAAHQVDMRLSRTKEWIKVFHKTGQAKNSGLIHEWIVEQLKKLEDVAHVNLTWEHLEKHNMMHIKAGHKMDQSSHQKTMADEKGMIRFHGSMISEITPPHYDALVQNETISLVSNLQDEDGVTIGRLEVSLYFKYLIKNIVESGWWQSHKAFLVDNTGKILVSTISEERLKLADNKNPLEQRTLYGIMAMSYGTFIGTGTFPSEVSGFYKLQQAPWNLVMIAPGKSILTSLFQFRMYYFVVGLVFILLILLLIRFVTGRTVNSIKEISDAADRIAKGEFNQTLLVKTEDEVGELTRSFNSMMQQLEERIRLKEAMDLAMEVQQNLFPQQSLQVLELDISGKSIYCDATGGDYIDFIQFSELGQGKIGIVVGDVVGHGIAAALLMTTARALLRCRLTQPGSLSQMMNDVNRLLCFDTSESGSFVTMFFVLFDPSNKCFQWVRAGHDPAILYDTSKDSFEDLDGKGTALGVDEKLYFQEYTYEEWNEDQIILIGTDGIWETSNLAGEMFGKKRVKEILQNHSESSAQEIIDAITDELATFRQEASQDDDITLAVIKFLR